MKKLILWLLCLGLVFGCLGCSQDEAQDTQPYTEDIQQRQVGLCLPNQTDDRWISDGKAIIQQLEELGYQVLLEDAREDARLQAEQLSALISQPVDCLIVSAVDEIALYSALLQAHNAGIPVIAYDRPLNPELTSAYTGMDYENLGVLIAQEIVRERQLDSATPSQHRYRMELFMGSPENPNAYSFYQGIMQVLQPHLDSGVLVVPSGRCLFEDACAPENSSEVGLQLCQQILSDYYTERWPDIILTGDDALALGCILALEGNCPEESWPIISGLGGTLKGAKRMIGNKLTLSSYFDTADMVDACLQAVDSAFSGQITTYEETRLPATVLHKRNYEGILLEGGIYTTAELFE